MMQQIANFIVDHDPMMVLQRTHDTVRYIRWAWNKDHADLIDEAWHGAGCQYLPQRVLHGRR